MTNYVAYTLVDITNTNESKHNRNHIKFYQQQNLNTLIQTIGLQQPESSVDVIMAQDIVNFGFGKQYLDYIQYGNTIQYRAWAYTKYMFYHCNIPVYTGLEETAEIKSKCFETVGPINVCFKQHNHIR